jgi:uncharacterized protein
MEKRKPKGGAGRLDPTDNANEIREIAERARRGKVGWGWPLLVSIVRLPLALLGLGLTYLVFAGLGSPYALELGYATSTFYFTFVNLICLTLLLWLIRREGIRLRDLIGFRREHLRRDVLFGMLWFFVLLVPLYAGIVLTALVAYCGPEAFERFQYIFASGASFEVPLWMVAWGAFVFPLVNAPVEEMHYRGYAQARLVALGGRPLIGVLIPALGFGLQHMAFAPTLQGATFYAVGFFLWGLGAGIIYHKQKRLMPMILAHFPSNFVITFAAFVATLVFR